jgi:hypothetical protein
MSDLPVYQSATLCCFGRRFSEHTCLGVGIWEVDGPLRGHRVAPNLERALLRGDAPQGLADRYAEPGLLAGILLGIPDHAMLQRRLGSTGNCMSTLRLVECGSGVIHPERTWEQAVESLWTLFCEPKDD